MSSLRAREILATASVALLASCTTFYGLIPDASTTSSSSSSTSGTGGGTPLPGLLPELDAAHVCSLVAKCPGLGDSVVASSGLPLVVPKASDTANFSSCVDWLTLPLDTGTTPSPARVGLASLRGLVDCLAATNTCADAVACPAVEVLPAGSADCMGMTSRCDGPDVVDCTTSVREHCANALFAPGSQCAVDAMGVPRCAVGACSTPEASCDQVSSMPENEQSFVFACVNGERLGVDCADLGLACDALSSMPADSNCSAAGSPATCTDFGASECLSGHARVCSGAYEADVDCTRLGGCVAEGSTVRCAPSTAACSPYDADINVCSSSSVSLCLAGVRMAFDCATIGLACIPAAGAVSGHCG